MKLLHSVILLGLALLIQSTFLKLVAIGGYQPDVIIMALFYVALLKGSYGATIAGFSIGLVQDLFAPQTLGLNALCKSIISFGLGFCQRGVFVEGLIPRSLILFAAVLVHDLLYFLIALWPQVGKSLGTTAALGLPTAVYTAIVAYVVFYLVHRRQEVELLQEIP